MCLDLPVYQNSAKRERLVFDPVLFAEPVREKDWINALNTSPTYIQYTPAEHDSRELETKARLMLRKIQRDVPIKLLKSPPGKKEKWRRSLPACLQLSLTAERYTVHSFVVVRGLVSPLSLSLPLSVIAELIFLSVIAFPFFCHCLSLSVIAGLDPDIHRFPGQAGE